MNWWIWLITLRLWGQYANFNLCFPEKKPFLLCYDLEQADEVYLCKQRWSSYLLLSTWSFQNLASPAGSPVDLMIYYNWITANCTNHCFNLFFVFKLFMICVSLLHYDFANLTSYINFTLFCENVVSYSNQGITRPPTKIFTVVSKTSSDLTGARITQHYASLPSSMTLLPPH